MHVNYSHLLRLNRLKNVHLCTCAAEIHDDDSANRLQLVPQPVAPLQGILIPVRPSSAPVYTHGCRTQSVCMRMSCLVEQQGSWLARANSRRHHAAAAASTINSLRVLATATLTRP